MAKSDRGGADRMRGFDSKLSFAESFIDLAETTPIDKITVNMIVERIGKHRKTFYYHFSDKEDLMRWLFRFDLAQGLENEFGMAHLVYEGAGGSYPDFPFYVRNVLGNGRIYNARFFEAFARSLESRRTYYRAVFSFRGLGSLEHYLYDLYCPELKADIVHLIRESLAEEPAILQAEQSERLLSGDGVDFLAEFFTGAFVQRIIKRLIDDPSRRTIDDIRPYENVIHDSLWLLIGSEMPRR